MNNITLKDIVDKVHDNIKFPVYVEYRTYIPEGDDIWTGGCYVYENYDLESIDKDTYCLSDLFSNYQLAKSEDEIYIKAYYESEWV